VVWCVLDRFYHPSSYYIYIHIHLPSFFFLFNSNTPFSFIKFLLLKTLAQTTLVNCAGVLEGGAFGSEACNMNNFMKNFNTNTKVVFEMMHSVVPLLRAAGVASNPSIVNVSSINGLVSFPGEKIDISFP
jgi:NADP-dependent 3-hydroxy acid dehydrogenase YdfG